MSLAFFTVGARIGAVFGSIECFRQGIPGAYRLRFVGQYTLISTGAFGAVLAVASFGHCLRRIG